MSELTKIENEVKNEVAKIETDTEQLWSKLEAWLQKHFYSQSLHVPVIARNELKAIAGETPDPKPLDTTASIGGDSVSGS